MAGMPLGWSLSRLTEEASSLTWYIYGSLLSQMAWTEYFLGDETKLEVRTVSPKTTVLGTILDACEKLLKRS
jgi:hypothetical protein